MSNDYFDDEPSAQDEAAFLAGAMFVMLLVGVAIIEYVKWAYR